MSTNLTVKQVNTWKTNLETAIKTNLIGTLKTINAKAKILKEITKSNTEANNDNLSYRFGDLANVTEKAISKLTTFINSFNTDLNQYLKVVDSAEKEASENIRKQIDQFAECAEKISKITM